MHPVRSWAASLASCVLCQVRLPTGGGEPAAGVCAGVVPVGVTLIVAKLLPVTQGTYVAREALLCVPTLGGVGCFLSAAASSSS